MSRGEDLARVLKFQLRSIELTAGAVSPIDEGWAIRTPSLPEVWSHNQVWLNQPIGYVRAIELCEQHLGDALFWQLFLEAGNERLRDRLSDDGWELDVEVHMRLERAPDRATDTASVIEPPEEESLELMARWMRDDPTLYLSEDGVGQSVGKDRDVWRARNARRFGIRCSDGALAAITQLFSDGPIGQVEHVYTAPGARGRGHARTLVTHAVAESLAAPHELTFIVADENDWPKELYRRIGFEPLGLTWLLHLPAARLAERRR